MSTLHWTDAGALDVLMILDDLCLLTEGRLLPDNRKSAYMRFFMRHSAAITAQEMCAALHKVIDTWDGQYHMPSPARILSLVPTKS